MSDNWLTSLDDLVFDNTFVRSLPGDPELENYCRQVEEAAYSLVEPTPTSAPSPVAYADAVAALLHLSPSICQSEYFTQVFSGNALLPGMQPFAMCYGGHQFGNWAGQLGDGRAINLGEVITTENQRWYLQLKGAGLTPYSRHADGLAVLRSSVREFLCSEAMYHLGVPTTRALSLSLTGDSVVRDMFYDGNSQAERGAVVCRVAPSFTRFGNFQLPISRGDESLLKALIDHTITTDFPHLGEPTVDTIVAWFGEVCDKTLEMVVHWMRVGFVHGVMNTDNMSILGLTIDYGPYGWLENYDPTWTPNTTDEGQRRYRYEHQPQVAHWNLLQLANAILPIVKDTEALENILHGFAKNFQIQHQAMQLSKLGLVDTQDGDDGLVADLLVLLTQAETDMTLFYRSLAQVDLTDVASKTYQSVLADAYYQDAPFTEEYDTALSEWLQRYAVRCEQAGVDNAQRASHMNGVNPLYVLRNYLSQLAIDKANEGDYSGIEELLSVLKQPYTQQPGKEHLAQKRPEWARNRAGCSMLSCSS